MKNVLIWTNFKLRLYFLCSFVSLVTLGIIMPLPAYSYTKEEYNRLLHHVPCRWLFMPCQLCT